MRTSRAALPMSLLEAVGSTRTHGHFFIFVLNASHRVCFCVYARCVKSDVPTATAKRPPSQLAAASMYGYTTGNSLCRLQNKTRAFGLTCQKSLHSKCTLCFMFHIMSDIDYSGSCLSTETCFHIPLLKEDLTRGGTKSLFCKSQVALKSRVKSQVLYQEFRVLNKSLALLTK